MAVQEVKQTINSEPRRMDGLLYGILDTGYVQPERMSQVAEALLAGGVGALQLRAKGYDCAGVIKLVREHLPQLAERCEAYGIPFVINDFAEAALELNATGLHIGQDDGSLEGVRKIVGEHMLVGRSTHSLHQARAALNEGFDYIGFGPLFPTPTKEGRPGIGIEQVSQVENEIGGEIPVFCIGGIKPQNLELVLASGARRVVIVSALLQAEDVTKATEQVVTQLCAH